MKFLPRMAEHTVSAAVADSVILPVPFAQEGTRMAITRARAEWRRAGTDPWRLAVVTVHGATNTGDGITVEYYPENPSKRPPRELAEWIGSTHPGHAREEQES